MSDASLSAIHREIANGESEGGNESEIGGRVGVPTVMPGDVATAMSEARASVSAAERARLDKVCPKPSTINPQPGTVNPKY